MLVISAKLLFHNLLYVLNIEKLNISFVKNRNIGSKHLGGKGIHLNPHGNAKLELNLKATLKKLWSKFGNLPPGYRM